MSTQFTSPISAPLGNEVNDGKLLPDDIFAQAKEFALPTPATETKIEVEDLQGLVEFPFDATALITRYKGFGLTDDESKRLAKLFLKPVQRLAIKTGNIDLLLGVTTLASIMTEKFIEYKLHLDSTRDSGQGKDLLSEKPIQAN